MGVDDLIQHMILDPIYLYAFYTHSNLYQATGYQVIYLTNLPFLSALLVMCELDDS